MPPRKGLTAKQRKFADGLILGLSQIEAYEAAGYSVRNRSAASVDASRLARNPKIAALVGQARESATEKALWSREKAVERLESVNSAAFSEIEENGLEKRPQSALAFFRSIDRLNRMHGCEEREKASDAPKIDLGVPAVPLED